jgi:hypothetical protein
MPFVHFCPKHQRRYIWKCPPCDQKAQGIGEDTPLPQPASQQPKQPDEFDSIEEWDYGRCQGVKNDGFQCPYQVAAGKRRYCKIHAR